MQNMNKKGLSNIIANVLIILLVISAIATLSTSIFNLVDSPALSPEKSCPILLSKKIIEVREACYNQETQETIITIQRNDKTQIESLSFILNQESYTCGNACNTCNILQEGIKKYYFPLESEEVSVVVNNCLIETKKITRC